MAAFSADVLAARTPALLRRARLAAGAGGLALIGLWLATLRMGSSEVPGADAQANRAAQLAIGQRLRVERTEHLEVTPCAYEHFALIAAFGAPERVHTRPGTGAPATAECPSVERQ